MIKGEYDNKENPVIRDWIRQLMALTMLPAFAIPLAWTWLKDPPPTGSPAADGKTRSLSNYYERTWINGTTPFVVVALRQWWTTNDERCRRMAQQPELAFWRFSFITTRVPGLASKMLIWRQVPWHPARCWSVAQSSGANLCPAGQPLLVS